MDLVIKYLESHRERILMDLDLIKNDTKTRYAIEKRKQLEPFLEQITRAVEILSSVPQANELLPHVSGSYYLLKEGDYIQAGDEYREEDGSWHKTGQIDKKYNPSKHYKHRRLK